MNGSSFLEEPLLETIDSWLSEAIADVDGARTRAPIRSHVKTTRSRGDRWSDCQKIPYYHLLHPLSQIGYPYSTATARELYMDAYPVRWRPSNYYAEQKPQTTVVRRFVEPKHGSRSRRTVTSDDHLSRRYRATVHLKPADTATIVRMLFSSVALCEYPAGCTDDATCRVIVRLVGKNVETYEYYCEYHCAIAERAALRDDQFELVDAGPY